jgi:hypothetical protein
MKILLVILIFFSTANLIAQDKVKNKIADLWWNNEIEILDSRNKLLNHDDAIYFIRNQKVSTNCWSKFYRYNQNIQQSSGEQIVFYPLEDAEIIEEDSSNFFIVATEDLDTGNKKISKLFSYRLIDSKNRVIEKDDQLNKFLNKQLKISKVIFKDSLDQLFDDCHIKYSIEFKEDGTFMQGYDDNTTCRCKINAEQFQQIHHIGFAKFDEANHSLLGLNGVWKIENHKLYLKFRSGNIYKYDYQTIGEKITLKNGITTIELRASADINGR